MNTLIFVIPYNNRYLVRLGDLHLDDRVNDGATPVDIAVENTYTHEKYSSSPITNDIALVRLKRTVQFTRKYFFLFFFFRKCKFNAI